MPRGVSSTRGVSPSEVLVNSGGEQFLLVNPVDNVVPTCDVTYAALPDGTYYNGQTSFSGAPAFTLGTINYIWLDTGTNLLANSTTTFTGASNQIPLWQVTLDGSGNFTSIIDRRPWFGDPPAASLILEDLTDVSADLSAGTRDTSVLRSSPATAANPLATLADVGGAASIMIGKTFIPVPRDDSYLGLVYNSVGTINAPLRTVGSVDLSTLGSVRTIPSGATHAVLRVYLDANIILNSGSITSYIGAYDAGLSVGAGPTYTLTDPNGFVSLPNVASATNGSFNVVGVTPGERNMNDMISVVVPMAGSSPHISWLYDQVTVSTDQRNLELWLDGFYVDEVAGAAPTINLEDNLDVSVDLSAGVRDTSVLRASPATAANPLATIADITASSFIGFSAVKTVPLGITAVNTIISSYQTVAFDVGSGFTALTGVYTIPADGYYQINASFHWTGTSAPGNQFIVSIGGSTSVSESMVNASLETGPGQGLSTLAQLTAGNTIALYASASSTGNIFVDFSAYKVG